MSDTEGSPDSGPSEAATGDDAEGEEDISVAKAVVEPASEPKGPRQLSVSLRSVVLAAVAGVVVIGYAALAWLYIGAHRQLHALEQTARDNQHAEELVTAYAVNAAEMDYQDFEGWKLKLVDGTSAELKEKLAKAADSMQQIMTPLQWTSTAHPLAAKVRSQVGGIYTVDAFVSVLTKTMQTPGGLQSTATYSVTLDGNNNWQIIDVGGIDAALGK